MTDIKCNAFKIQNNSAENKVMGAGCEMMSDEISGFTSMKIIQLSKQIRELNASLNSEKAKCALLTKQLRDRDNELNCLRKNQQSNHEPVDKDTLKNNHVSKSNSNKFEQQVSELRNQVQLLNHDLKLAKKALELETGELIPNLSHWLATSKIDATDKNTNNSAGWRGRQQKISYLQGRIRILESLLNRNSREKLATSEKLCTEIRDTNDNFSGASHIGVDYFRGLETCYDFESGLSRSEYSHNTTLSNQTISKLDYLQKEKERLEDELINTKKKLSSSKLRLNNSSIELKGLKEKICMMAQKGYNDDRLVDSLIKHNEALRSAVIELNTRIQKAEGYAQQKENELFSVVMQNKTETEKLKEIIAERDSKITELTRQISELDNSIHATQNFSNQGTENYSSYQETDITSFKEHEEIKNLKTKLDSMKKLVECLDDRFEQTMEQKLLYEIECSRLKQILSSKEDESESATKCRKANARSSQNRKPVSAQMQENKLPSVKLEVQPNLEHLLSDQLVDEILNKAGLGASAAKIVSKRVRELQAIISDFHDQIKLLQAKSDEFHRARRQDIDFLSQIVNEIRSQNSKDN